MSLHAAPHPLYCFLLALFPLLPLTSEPTTAQKAANKPSAAPAIRFSVTSSYPTGETDVGFGLSHSWITGSALMRDGDGIGSEPFDIRTWSLKIRPRESVSLYAGSISASGLPSRAKNPVSPISSPSFAVPSASAQSLLRSGTTLDTQALGLEAGGKSFRIAAVGHMFDRYASPSWLSTTVHLPPIGPDATRLSFALFSGFRALPESSEDTWFVPDPALPETWLFLPAAELLLNGRRLQASCSAYASLKSLSESAGTLRADVLLRGSHLALGARWLRSAQGFRDFNGSEDPIREQIALAPAIYVSLTRETGLSMKLSALVARETLSGDSFNEPNQTRLYYGGIIEAQHAHFSTAITIERDESEDAYSAETTIYRFPVRDAKIEARITAIASASEGTVREVSSVSGDTTLTSRLRPGIRARGSAGFTSILKEGRVDPRWSVAVSVAPVSSRKATPTITIALRRESLHLPLSGSLGIRVQVR